MSSENIYTYVVDYLYDLLCNTQLLGIGARDTKIDKFTEASICDIFERYIYQEPGNNPVFFMAKNEDLRIFNGEYYQHASVEVFMQIIKRTMAKLDIGLVYQKNSYNKIALSCIEGLKAYERTHFHPNRGYLVFNNGVLVLKEKALVPFDSAYMTDIHFDFDYTANATDDLWESKVKEIIPDEGMRDALQMFLGCLLLKREEIKVEYACFLLGTGGNGKSVLINAVVDMFGEELFSRFSPEQLFKSQQSLFNLAELEDKVANFCDDVSNKDFSGGEFKSFASGESFSARHPYGHNFFKVKAPWLICCANEMPPTTDDSEGFHRRFLVITTSSITRTGKDKDPELPFKLRSKHVQQAIFNWILKGYYKVVECHGNIQLSGSVLDTQKMIREDSNSVRRWIRDMGYKPEVPRNGSDDGWKSLVDWFALYKKYCEENGERSPQKSTSVSKSLRGMGFINERRSGGMWFYMVQSDTEAEFMDGEEDLPF